MERHAFAALRAWKDDPARKPLVMRGARQVGKTWLLREFGETAYAKTVYLNCQRNPSVAAVFEGDVAPSGL